MKLPEDTFELVPLKDTSRFVPPIEERALGVIEVGMVDAAVGTSGLAFSL